MSLREMKDELHDKLWNAQQFWFQLRGDGWTKHAIKMAGIRSTGDANTLMRGIIFTGRTRVTYERHLKSFLAYANEKAGVQRMSDVTVVEARAYLEHCISEGWATKTLNTLRSALAKLGALVGKTDSFAALSREYGQRIRELTRAGKIAGPSRATPSPEVVERAVAILATWDARHVARTGQCRAYALAARLQMETAARSVSATERVTAASLLDDNRIALLGKGGKEQVLVLSPDLHARLVMHLAANGGALAGLRGYQVAYARAISAAGGHVGGTHGLRRLSIQAYYRTTCRERIKQGLSPSEARAAATGDAVQRLGHGRNRNDHARWYLR